MQNHQEKRSAFVALIGAPNAGKSTLVNFLVGQKIAIVTHKVQTTRYRIRGVRLYNDTQLVFIDTPGIFSPKKTLERALVASAWNGARDGDFILFLLDAKLGFKATSRKILEKLSSLKQEKILVINKVDLVSKETLLPLAELLQKEAKFSKTFMISAQTGTGCKDLLEYLAKAAPRGPWFFPEDQLCDMPLQQMAAELTREKLFLRLHEELPYALTVEAEAWQQKNDKSIVIRQAIIVERDSQKKIVIGKNGRYLKEIGQKVREELCELLGVKVHLFLFVKTRPDWSEKPAYYSQNGLEFIK